MSSMVLDMMILVRSTKEINEAQELKNYSESLR